MILAMRVQVRRGAAVAERKLCFGGGRGAGNGSGRGSGHGSGSGSGSGMDTHHLAKMGPRCETRGLCHVIAQLTVTRTTY